MQVLETRHPLSSSTTADLVTGSIVVTGWLIASALIVAWMTCLSWITAGAFSKGDRCSTFFVFGNAVDYN
jgi:hypothetical protein